MIRTLGAGRGISGPRQRGPARVSFVKEEGRQGVRDTLASAARRQARDGGDGTVATAEPPLRTTYRRAQPKIGPNEPCPCGSGKKFKKCCGAPNARPAAPPAE
jgi:hypothetical protein